MKRYHSVGHRLPQLFAKRLFGDRAAHGLQPDRADPQWLEWLSRSTDFYHANQRQSLGRLVNHSGYRVMKDVDLAGKKVLEIGAGALDHMQYWKSRPEHYVCLDVNQDYLDLAVAQLKRANIGHTTVLQDNPDSVAIPLESGSIDVVVSFYSLEHIYPLSPFLAEIERVLKSV
jgi:ubiquinone/menaquinone biosynthesis C-methylase UbiE